MYVHRYHCYCHLLLCFLCLLSQYCWWQLTEADQELYKNFPLVVSDRWQNEIAETVFEVVNQEADKIESKRRHRPRSDEPDEIGMIHLWCRYDSGIV